MGKNNRKNKTTAGSSAVPPPQPAPQRPNDDDIDPELLELMRTLKLSQEEAELYREEKAKQKRREERAAEAPKKQARKEKKIRAKRAEAWEKAKVLDNSLYGASKHWGSKKSGSGTKQSTHASVPSSYTEASSCTFTQEDVEELDYGHLLECVPVGTDETELARTAVGGRKCRPDAVRFGLQVWQEMQQIVSYTHGGRSDEPQGCANKLFTWEDVTSRVSFKCLLCKNAKGKATDFAWEHLYGEDSLAAKHWERWEARERKIKTTRQLLELLIFAGDGAGGAERNGGGNGGQPRADAEALQNRGGNSSDAFKPVNPANPVADCEYLALALVEDWEHKVNCVVLRCLLCGEHQDKPLETDADVMALCGHGSRPKWYCEGNKAHEKKAWAFHGGANCKDYAPARDSVREAKQKLIDANPDFYGQCAADDDREDTLSEGGESESDSGETERDDADGLFTVVDERSSSSSSQAPAARQRTSNTRVNLQSSSAWPNAAGARSGRIQGSSNTTDSSEGSHVSDPGLYNS